MSDTILSNGGKLVEGARFCAAVTGPVIMTLGHLHVQSRQNPVIHAFLHIDLSSASFFVF